MPENGHTSFSLGFHCGIWCSQMNGYFLSLGFCCPYCYLKHTIDFKVLWHHILFSVGPTNGLRVFFGVRATLNFMISLCTWSSERLSPCSPTIRRRRWLLLHVALLVIDRYGERTVFFYCSFQFSALIACCFPESLEWDLLSGPVPPE